MERRKQNILQKLYSREVHGSFFRGHKVVHNKAIRLFGSIPERLMILLAEMFEGRFKHLLVGTSRCGQFLITYSYTSELRPSPEILMAYKYRLHWWAFRGKAPAIKVAEVQLFDSQDTPTNPLHIGIAQWPNVNDRLVVYGYSDEDDPRYSDDLDSAVVNRKYYITVTTLPSVHNCRDCKAVAESFDDEDMAAIWDRAISFSCLKHGLTIHTTLDVAPPYPAFDPLTSLKIDNKIIVNTGNFLHVLSFAPDKKEKSSTEPETIVPDEISHRLGELLLTRVKDYSCPWKMSGNTSNLGFPHRKTISKSNAWLNTIMDRANKVYAFEETEDGCEPRFKWFKKRRLADVMYEFCSDDEDMENKCPPSKLQRYNIEKENIFHDPQRDRNDMLAVNISKLERKIVERESRLDVLKKREERGKDIWLRGSQDRPPIPGNSGIPFVYQKRVFFPGKEMGNKHSLPHSSKCIDELCNNHYVSSISDIKQKSSDSDARSTQSCVHKSTDGDARSTESCVQKSTDGDARSTESCVQKSTDGDGRSTQSCVQKSTDGRSTQSCVQKSTDGDGRSTQTCVQKSTDSDGKSTQSCVDYIPGNSGVPMVHPKRIVFTGKEMGNKHSLPHSSKHSSKCSVYCPFSMDELCDNYYMSSISDIKQKSTDSDARSTQNCVQKSTDSDARSTQSCVQKSTDSGARSTQSCVQKSTDSGARSTQSFVQKSSDSDGKSTQSCVDYLQKSSKTPVTLACDSHQVSSTSEIKAVPSKFDHNIPPLNISVINPDLASILAEWEAESVSSLSPRSDSVSKNDVIQSFLELIPGMTISPRNSGAGSSTGTSENLSPKDGAHSASRISSPNSSAVNKYSPLLVVLRTRNCNQDKEPQKNKEQEDRLKADTKEEVAPKVKSTKEADISGRQQMISGCSVRFDRIYIELDDEILSSISTDLEDDDPGTEFQCALPLSVHGSAYAQLQMVSSQKAEKLSMDCERVYQTSFDIEQFCFKAAEIICQCEGYKFWFCSDYDVELIDVCAFNGDLLGVVCMRVNAEAPSKPVIDLSETERNFYSLKCVFVWNPVVDRCWLEAYSPLVETKQVGHGAWETPARLEAERLRTHLHTATLFTLASHPPIRTFEHRMWATEVLTPSIDELRDYKNLIGIKLLARRPSSRREASQKCIAEFWG